MRLQIPPHVIAVALEKEMRPRCEASAAQLGATVVHVDADLDVLNAAIAHGPRAIVCTASFTTAMQSLRGRLDELCVPIVVIPRASFTEHELHALLRDAIAVAARRRMTIPPSG